MWAWAHSVITHTRKYFHTLPLQLQFRESLVTVGCSWGQTGHEWAIHCCQSWCFCVTIMQCSLMFFMPIVCLTLTVTFVVCEDCGHRVILRPMLSACFLALNKMHYSVLPRQLHYSLGLLMSCCHVWFGLGFGFGLGFEHLNFCLACQGLGLGLGLELLSLESKPAEHLYTYTHAVASCQWRRQDFVRGGARN